MSVPYTYKQPYLNDTAQPRPPATGPLAAHPTNPRYFADAEGHAVYLVGSHTWANFVDIGFEGEKPFDYDLYLDFMAEHHLNFMRLWQWEHAAWATWTPEKLTFGPMPYRRVGPDLALDGKPKFDLTLFDQAYFDRMRGRLIMARDRGIYAAVMLFQAFSGKWPKSQDHQNDVFRGHYYNAKNNVQNFNGDDDGNSILDIDEPDVRRYQAAYLRKIVDTVNDLDNVLYEVINEGGNENWNEFVVRTVHDYEKTLGKQHPIGVTGHGGVDLEGALRSACEWVSPGVWDSPDFTDAKKNPPLWDGKKVCVVDTDHHWGHGIDYKWVWKSFLRGHNVLFMDPWGPLPGWHDAPRNVPDYPGYQEARKAMRNTALLATRMEMAQMVPSKELASTGYCLANPGQEYLAYLPEGGEVTIDLSQAKGDMTVEWISPIEGALIPGGGVKGGSKHSLGCPISNDAVLHIFSKEQAK